jgi:large subunit ribosomal protein L24
MKFKTGDRVKILAGKDAGKEGNISRVINEKNRVIVNGINIVKKHEKAQQRAKSSTQNVMQGGIIDREMPIHASNVAYIGADGKPTRIGYKVNEDGTKVRIDRKTGNTI